MKFRCRNKIRNILYGPRRSNLRQCITIFLCIIFVNTIILSGCIVEDFQNNAKSKVIDQGDNYRSNTSVINVTKTNAESSESTYKTTFELFSSTIPPDDCRLRKSGLISMSPKILPLTALASPFRSGNTWVRHLLQMTTGIGTSALYCDSELHFNGFPFECNHTHYTQMLVVKTHEPRPPGPPKRVAIKTSNGVREILVPQTRMRNLPFDRAVLLIRDPYNFLVGNMYTGHKDVVKEEEFFGISRQDTLVYISEWRIALPGLLKWWKDFNAYWLTLFRGPVYPLLYSNLLIDTKTELIKLLNFLNVTYIDSDVRCAIDNQKGNFKRKQIVWTGINDITELFDHTMKTKIDSSVKILSEYLRTKYGVEWLNETHNVRVS